MISEQEPSAGKIYELAPGFAVEVRIAPLSEENDKQPAGDIVFRVMTRGELHLQPLSELLPPGTRIIFSPGHALAFGYHYADKKLTIAPEWFNLDGKTAAFMTFHEVGHSVDAGERHDLYMETDGGMREDTPAELASKERNADLYLAQLLDRLGGGELALFSEAELGERIKAHLLGYQVGLSFKDSIETPPPFLKLEYQSELWDERRSLLKKVTEELGPPIDAQADDLFSELRETVPLTEGRVARKVGEVFGAFPYFDRVTRFFPQLAADLFSIVSRDDFIGGGMQEFRRTITDALLDERLGIVPFIAHERLLSTESLARLQHAGADFLAAFQSSQI